MDTSILNKLLATFTQVFTFGAAAIIPDALWLLRMLATMEIALVGLWWMYSHDNSLAIFIAKLVGFGFLLWLIQQWPTLTKTLILSFIGVGLKAGGDVITETDFTNPSNIALYGMSVTAVVFTHLKEYSAIDAMKNIVEILFSGWAAMGIVLTYFTLAIWIFVALVEFYGLTAVTVILVPFAMFGKTAFLAEKALAVIFASGIRVLVLSFITGATLPILYSLQTGMNPRFYDVMCLFLGALAVLALAWRADKLSQGILHGAPQLTVSDVQRVVQNTAQTMTMVGNVGHAVRTGTSNAVSRLGTLARRRP